MNKTLLLGTAALFAISLSGCGGDPLVATWRFDILAMTPSLSSSVTELYNDYTFTGDRLASVSSHAKYTTTSPQFPGCTVDASVTGLSWSTATSNGVSTLTIGGTPTGTQQRSGCMNASDNLAREAFNVNASQFTFSGTYSLTNNNNTLTVNTTSGGSQMSVTLTRR